MAFFGHFPAELGPATRSNGSGSKNSATNCVRREAGGRDCAIKVGKMWGLPTHLSHFYCTISAPRPPSGHIVVQCLYCVFPLYPRAHLSKSKAYPGDPAEGSRKYVGKHGQAVLDEEQSRLMNESDPRQRPGAERRLLRLINSTSGPRAGRPGPLLSRFWPQAHCERTKNLSQTTRPSPRAAWDRFSVRSHPVCGQNRPKTGP